MPGKYSHVKKRSTNTQQRKSNKSNNNASAGASSSSSSPSSNHAHTHTHAHRNPNLHLDRTLSQAMSAVSELERAISRILLLRYEHDIARLYSTRLHSVALMYLPKLILDCVDAAASPGWVAVNAECEEVKDFFRAAIAMDMRQAGERVATKSVLWSYTALRHFAMSNGVHICPKRGLHSIRLLPHFPALKTHLDTLESTPTASFTKPTHLPPLDESLDLLIDDLAHLSSITTWPDWRVKVRAGYERLVDTLWAVAREFDVRGYGLILREKLTAKWCECGCSTDHLGEVCERTVREEEEESGIRPGKEREWDGRGSGVYGWQTEDEEDIWEMDLDFGELEADECDDPEMTIGELMEWRYFKAERAKEQGNKEFRNCDYEAAIRHYINAHEIEPELPHYQLNIAAAHLKLSNWMAAEKACNIALGQHRSGKGYWRRAKARRMMGKVNEAVKDLRAVLKLQPTNPEVLAELESVLSMNSTRAKSKPPRLKSQDLTYSGPGPAAGSGSTYDPGPGASSSSSSSQTYPSHAHSSSSSSIITNGHPHTNGHTRSPSLNNHTTKHTKPPAALPFIPSEMDRCKLRISTTPLQVEMPVVRKRKERNGAKDGKKDKDGKGKGEKKVNGVGGEGGKGKEEGGPVFELKLETYSYPTWERCKVQKVAR